MEEIVKRPYGISTKGRFPDMHAHLSCLTDELGKGLSMADARALGEKELKLREQHGIVTFFSCGIPREWEFMQKYRSPQSCESGENYGDIFLSFGIHPWYADQYLPEEYIEYFRNCDAVGEIGMDSVWCNVLLSVQRRCFEQQLQIAADLHKPIVLHTKGQEEAILEMIQGFPEKICVHWYSGDRKVFDKFLELGCYFTCGPDMADACAGADITANGCVNRETAERYWHMLKEIPLDRLFIETDGISAVAWAKGEEALELEEIPLVLGENLEYAARQKKRSMEDLMDQMLRNLKCFLGINVNKCKSRFFC